MPLDVVYPRVRLADSLQLFAVAKSSLSLVSEPPPRVFAAPRCSNDDLLIRKGVVALPAPLDDVEQLRPAPPPGVEFQRTVTAVSFWPLPSIVPPRALAALEPNQIPAQLSDLLVTFHIGRPARF